MMIMAACMPVVGLLSSTVGYTAAFSIFALLVLALFGWLLRYMQVHDLLGPAASATRATASPAA